jgi:hypothetical protein
LFPPLSKKDKVTSVVLSASRTLPMLPMLSKL